MRQPRLDTADDGEVTLTYEAPGLYLEIGTYGGPEYSYFGRDDQSYRFCGDSYTYWEPHPELVEFFARFPA